MKLPTLQKISPFLWFNDQAEAAVKFYTGIFPRSKITAVMRYGEEAASHTNRKPGSVMTIGFRLAGQDFTALNGGPIFSFTEAVSLVVNCRDQKEVDYYWDRLSRGGEKSQCGWLKDKFGLSWQVVPTEALGLMFSRKKGAAQRVASAVLRMQKIDIAVLRRAAAGR
jgi:predicted 3-demethylubiquinone-9 3-methyltransferase (glyoxalase superfamily)